MYNIYIYFLYLYIYNIFIFLCLLVYIFITGAHARGYRGLFRNVIYLRITKKQTRTQDHLETVLKSEWCSRTSRLRRRRLYTYFWRGNARSWNREDPLCAILFNGFEPVIEELVVTIVIIVETLSDNYNRNTLVSHNRGLIGECLFATRSRSCSC